MSEPSFLDLGVSKIVSDTLAARDIIAPFAIQRLVLQDGIDGRDVLAKSRTGSGKTLGFAIPIVERLDPKGAKPQAVVLVPTRELCVQVTEDMADIAKAKGLRVQSVYGGVGIKEQANAAARAHIIIATPGRIEDLCNRRLIKLDAVSILVLDEADRMLDMGFLPQVQRIVERIPAERQTMFFSATLDGSVGQVAKAWTNNPARHEVASPVQTVEHMDHKFIPVSQQEKLDKLVEMLQEPDRGLTLVFVRTKRGADRLEQKLKARDINAVAMHGDLSQAARERALARFDSGRADVLVATDVAARGLDLEKITHVVNFDPPDDDKSYVHRVGRTARAGRSGTGITFVTPEQRGDVGRMAARLQLDEAFTEEGMTVPPPRSVYRAKSRGRNALLGRRPRRRF